MAYDSLSQAFFCRVLQNMHTQALDIKTNKLLFLHEIFVCLTVGPASLKIP